jgi:2-polyprenyl-6-methoxyphenol hydroxylase-like FAD-dependent oxidoreductase
LRVLVCGGGIGGLTLALALRPAGIEVEVFDRAPGIEHLSVGGGLHVWPNGMRGLRLAGVADRVPGRDDEAAVLRRAEFWSTRPRLLGAFDVESFERRLGEPTVGVVRSELHAMLTDALEPGVLRLGKELVGFADDGDGVTARFAGGDAVRGDVLVGADGLRSAVRRQLHGSARPRYAGYTSWQGFAEPLGDATPPGVLRVTFGPGARFLAYHVGEGRLYWEAIVAAPEGRLEGFDAVLEVFGGWPAPTGDVLRATVGDAWRTDVYDRPPLRRWGRGRVTLLGDAAHPMTNAVGQGANQAIEDAIVLARALAHDDPVPALRAYERRRRGRTTQMVRMASGLAALARIHHPAALRAREALLANVFFGSFGSWKQPRDLDYSGE